MKILTWWWMVLILALSGLVVSSQEVPETLIRIETDTVAMRTGTYYEVQIVVENVAELWLADVVVNYDPATLYIVGTQSGSPVLTGDFMIQPRFVARNRVEGNQLLFTPSLLAPADSVSGTGVIGTFQVYPLQAGTATIRFDVASLTRITFTQDSAGQRVVDETFEIPVLPVQLDVTITGESVEPPDEATATPTITPTIDPVFLGEETLEAEPTLVNVTAAPRTATPAPRPTLIPDIVGQDGGDNSGGLLIGVGLVLVALLGLVALYFMRRR